ncbi:ATP-binding cassette domain-containing protein [Methanolobus sp. ZRKC3]|uniref:ATP-binding cassette domain-containing protein n=1 Tax=Methanolobus sp. ZRKC3 TaxID=3125786 RepID=UPI003243EC2A
MSIDIKNLSFSYNKGSSLEKTVLDNVTLSIKKGEFVVISGDVGSGKSTLIRHMNGLLKPCSGSVEVDGILAHQRKVRSKVGMLFQFPQKQLFGKTVLEDISFGPSNFGANALDVEKHVNEALVLTGLDAKLCSLSPFSLSGGQMRLVAMAGVLASKPDYLILDEPGSGLDLENRSSLFSTLKQLNSAGISIVVVSHQVSEMLPLADKVFLMDSGKLVFEGNPQEYMSSVSSHLPEITSLMKGLHARGFDVRTDISNLDEAFDEICALWKSREGIHK